MTKRLSMLVTILALVFFMPGIVLAVPIQIDTIHTAILAQAATSDSEINLTPQLRQQLQGVRQRRNREIKAVLDSSQRAKLAHNLRGNDISQALETLDLQPEQQDLVKTIVQFTNLKMKAILSRHPVQVDQ
jgi:predicted PurR-regulated permease PerM